jgi:hypothetical protein
MALIISKWNEGPLQDQEQGRQALIPYGTFLVLQLYLLKFSMQNDKAPLAFCKYFPQQRMITTQKRRCLRLDRHVKKLLE